VKLKGDQPYETAIIRRRLTGRERGMIGKALHTWSFQEGNDGGQEVGKKRPTANWG